MAAPTPAPAPTCRATSTETGAATSLSGAPGETVRDVGGAGAVVVSYSIGGDLLHTVLTSAAVTAPSAGARFGSSLTCGDFDGDGNDDLAVAAAGWSDGAGEVFVFYGSPSGVGSNLAVKNLRIRQEDVGEHSEKNDAFGVALASGDLDGDGVDDLAIGSPGEDWESSSLYGDVGLVYVVPGSAVGLVTPGRIVKECCGTDNRTAARYGHALAIGDVDGDGREDLAIGAPDGDAQVPSGQVVGGAGTVQLLRGSAVGMVTTTGSQLLARGAFAGWSSAFRDGFGTALAFGDFDGNGVADLAVESVASDGANGVFVHSSDGTNLQPDGPVVTAGWEALPGAPSFGDAFGRSLATGDLDGDGRDDLAIGVPNANGSAKRAGATAVAYGSAGVLDGARAQQFDGPAVDNGLAGFAVSIVDLDGDGVQDLAVGVPGQMVDSVFNAGVVHVHRGVAGVGLTGAAPLVVSEGIHKGWSDSGDAGTGSSWYEWGWTNDLMTGERLGTAIG